MGTCPSADLDHHRRLEQSSDEEVDGFELRAAAAAAAQVDEALLRAVRDGSQSDRFVVREEGDTLLVRAVPPAQAPPGAEDAAAQPPPPPAEDLFRGDRAAVQSAAMSGDFHAVARLLRGRTPDDELRAQLLSLLLNSRASVRALVANLRDMVCGDLIERTKEASLALLAALSGEHTLLLGPPGTAKSMLAARLKLAFHRPQYFERLLTRFSVPEELFGPLSVKALEQDKYMRLVTGYLPCASVAFVDEIFKANSAILNSLLTILNERKFDNGTDRIAVPLITLVGASNELPNATELGALFDRFLVRMWVDALSDQGFQQLLDFGRKRGDEARGADPAALPLSEEDVKRLQREASAVAIPPETLALIRGYRAWLRSEKIYCSDRRWLQIVKLLKMAAYTNGDAQVSVWDCWLLQHLTWDDNSQRLKMALWFKRYVGIDRVATRKATLSAGLAKLRRQLKTKQDWVSYHTEAAAPAPAPAPVAAAAAEEELDEEGQMELARQLSSMEAVQAAEQKEQEVRLVPATEIEQRVAELGALRVDVAAAQAEADALVAQLRGVVDGHVWLGPVHGVEAEEWVAEVQAQAADVGAMGAEVAELEGLFRALPS